MKTHVNLNRVIGSRRIKKFLVSPITLCDTHAELRGEAKDDMGNTQMREFSVHVSVMAKSLEVRYVCLQEKQQVCSCVAVNLLEGDTLPLTRGS